MQPRILNPAKALRTLRKTSALLQRALVDCDQAAATTLRDGPDGWSILFIACHLRDYERIVAARVGLILTEDDPTLPAIDNAAAERSGDYAHQELTAVLADLQARRAALLTRLTALDVAAWARSGHHPTQGHGTLLDVAINTGLHDIDHLEQIAQCRELGA
jgi:hypothetical protein